MPFEILTLDDFPALAAPEETGPHLCRECPRQSPLLRPGHRGAHGRGGFGLEIDALDGLPGVESARYGGADASYARKFALIYDALRSKHAPGSPARFVCAVALAIPSGPPGDSRVLFETEGVIEGQIAGEPKGEGGFGTTRFSITRHSARRWPKPEIANQSSVTAGTHFARCGSSLSLIPNP